MSSGTVPSLRSCKQHYSPNFGRKWHFAHQLIKHKHLHTYLNIILPLFLFNRSIDVWLIYISCTCFVVVICSHKKEKRKKEKKKRLACFDRYCVEKLNRYWKKKKKKPKNQKENKRSKWFYMIFNLGSTFPTCLRTNQIYMVRNSNKEDFTNSF